MRPLLARLLALFRRRKADDDLSDEIAAHLEFATADRVTAGLSVDQARLAAARRFGGVLQITEACRERQGFPVIESVGRDIRHAVRGLCRNPVFTAVAVLTLALGIGATTTIFSVIHAVLLRPSPFPNADRLVQIVENVPAEDSVTGRAIRLSSMNLSEFDFWRRSAHTLANIAITVPDTRTMTTQDGIQLLTGARISPALFPMRGVKPMLGRWMNPDGEQRESDVVVLSLATWRRFLGSDPNLVGRTIALDGRPYTVIGVMPPEFGEQAFWTPFVAELPQPGSVQLVGVTALLRDGVALETAAAEITTLGTGLRGVPSGRGGPPRFEVVRVDEAEVAAVRPALRVLVVAVVAVLLIVCANVANLLLVRGAARHREIAIRRAIGAARGRIVRQLLTESLVLSLAGAVGGTAMAYAGVLLVKAASLITIPARFRGALGPLGQTILPRADQVALDPTVLVFALALSVLTGIVFGFAPALRLSRVHHGQFVGADLTTPGDVSGRRSHRAGHLLAVVQMGLATTLLIGSGLLLRSFVNLSTVFLGFRLDTQIFQLVAPREYGRSRKMTLAYDLAARLSALPGVEAAGFINQPPLTSARIFQNLYLPAALEAQRNSFGDDDRTVIRGVSSGYLPALGVRLIEGRWL